MVSLRGKAKNAWDDGGGGKGSKVLLRRCIGSCSPGAEPVKDVAGDLPPAIGLWDFGTYCAHKMRLIIRRDQVGT